MGKKVKYSLAQQESELGAIIDSNLNDEQQQKGKNKEEETVTQNTVIQPALLPSQIKGKEQRTMIKQLWLDEDIYNRCVQAQANRKKQKLPASFDTLAYDALVFFLDSLDK